MIIIPKTSIYYYLVIMHIKCHVYDVNCLEIKPFQTIAETIQHEMFKYRFIIEIITVVRNFLTFILIVTLLG